MLDQVKSLILLLFVLFAIIHSSASTCVSDPGCHENSGCSFGGVVGGTCLASFCCPN